MGKIEYMTEQEILKYNRRCVNFLNLKKHTDTKKEEEWYLECYPNLPEFREGYDLPFNFPDMYEHPSIVPIFFNNPDDVPIQTERVALVKLKFHSDWNWIMEIKEKLQHNGYYFMIYPNTITIVDSCLISAKTLFTIQYNMNNPKEGFVKAINQILEILENNGENS
jgi:hypothetical protein